MKLRNCISKLHLDINISIKLNEMLIDALWFFFFFAFVGRLKCFLTKLLLAGGR